MKFCPRFSALSALTLGLALYTAPVHADVFDWNNVSFAPALASTATSVPRTTLNNTALTSNTLSIQIDLQNGANFLASSVAPSPVAGSNTTNTNNADNRFNTAYAVGGQATTQKALQLGANFGANTQYMLVTIFFARPVTSVNFSFFDIDVPASTTGNQYVDQVRSIQAINSNNGATINPVSLTNVNNNYTTVDSSSQVTAKANNNQADNFANATATFSSSVPISQFSFIYGDAYTGTLTHSNQQLIALGNITFTNAVPEPGTTALMILGAFGTAGVAFRRRGSK